MSRFIAFRPGRILRGDSAIMLLNLIKGFKVLKCWCAGISSCCNAKTVLINPAIPADASKWPILVLTDPKKYWFFVFCLILRQWL